MSEQDETKPESPAWLTTQPAVNGQSEKPKRTRRTQAQIAEAEARGEKVRRGSRAPSEPAGIEVTIDGNGKSAQEIANEIESHLVPRWQPPQWLPLAVGALAIVIALVALLRH